MALAARDSARNRSVTSTIVELTPRTWPGGSSSRKYEADQAWSVPGSPGVWPCERASITGSPLSSTCRITDSTSLPLIPGSTSVTRRPRCPSIETPFTRASASLRRTKRSSVS